MPKLKVLRQTPASLGYAFPPEWAPHRATWFSWPRPEGISFPDKYYTVPENLARIFREIAPRERVEINVPNGNYERIVREQLVEHGCPVKNIFFHHIKTNESWCRDHGPAFVVRKNPRSGRRETAIVDWGFNAWGGKYPPYDDDDRVPSRIAEELGLPVFYPVAGHGAGVSAGSLLDREHGRGAGATQEYGRGTCATEEYKEEHRRGTCATLEHGRDARATGQAAVVMEGGSVEFNGAGTTLTTTQCLLNKNRNPGLSKSQIEQYLKDYYGQTHICWLGDGIVGDDTDGHIDDLARFINPSTIVVGVEDDPKDENFDILRDNLKRVRKLKDQAGNPFNIVEIPMPGVVEHDGQRLPATYVNFYFINGALLVPTFRNKKHDRIAIETLQQHLPRHKVIGIDCVELIWGLGAIHCLSQQQPRA